MLIRLPDLESFIEEAQRARAITVYTALLSDFRRANGLPLIRARFAATAVGELSCHAGGPERALLRYERDFGTAADVLKEGADYRAKVESFAGEARVKLAAAGFEVRSGVITAL